jgi:Family of unknown function (DUF6496)
MPEKRTLQRAKQDKREGKAPSTQAGEFVREEMDHIREGKHGARSTKQAIAIGLSKARRAGVKLAPPKEGTASEKTTRSARSAYRKGQHGATKVSAKRSSARRRGPAARSAAAKKAVRTKGSAARSAAAKKAARTRARKRTKTRR